MVTTPVQLRVVDASRGRILAPEHCPFSVAIENGILEGQMMVQVSLCSMCKLCDFQVQQVSSVDVLAVEEARTLVRQAVLADQSLLESCMKQIKYLQRKERIPLIVLISFDALKKAVIATGAPEGLRALNRVLVMEGPICVISGVPLYFSDKLTRSPIQVVGEVEWVV